MQRAPLLFLIALALCLSTGPAVYAGRPFSGVTSTASGYHTWDSDLINIEQAGQTGAGVYVAVLDTGLAPNWRDYFPQARVAEQLGAGFDQSVNFASNGDPCKFDVSVGPLRQTTWVGSTTSTHGTHVASTILGYFYDSNYDTLAGYDLPPVMVRGIAPEATLIPVKVLASYQVPALPQCTNPGPSAAQYVTFGTSEMIAAGLRYVTDLARSGYRPMIVNMSLGGSELEAVEQEALDYAIANGVIVVASAGNEGEAGMGYPGAYAPVISAGAAGWTKEWISPATGSPGYRMWWLKYNQAPMMAGSGDVTEEQLANDVYVSDFSSRALPGQQLDLLAPGSSVRGPYPGEPGYSRVPWWSKGIGDLVSYASTNFFYASGTSMAAPHVASVAALLLQKNPTLTQAQVEQALTSTALTLPTSGTKAIFYFSNPNTMSWDTDCGGSVCDPVGAGLLQADAALAAIGAP